MNNSASISLYEGEYVNIAATWNSSDLSFANETFYDRCQSYVFFEKGKAIKQTISDQKLLQLWEKKTAVNKTLGHYLEYFAKQVELRDAKNRIKCVEKRFCCSWFEWNFFVGTIVFSQFMSDKYNKLFFYLAIGAGLMSCLKYFNFLREYSSLTAKIRDCEDKELQFKEKRQNLIFAEIKIAYKMAKGKAVFIYQ